MTSAPAMAGMYRKLVLMGLLAIALAGTHEEGVKFLEENKEREGVVTLKSGLQYKVLKKGTGKYHPKKETSCECHYAGTTPALTPNAIDLPESEWKEFDSSYKRGSPSAFSPAGVIKGWTEAMQLMVEGDKWELYIPSELGYGDTGSGEKIKGGDVLIFRMELIKIAGSGKVRAQLCDLTTRTDCWPEEVTLLDAWAKKPLEEVETEVSLLKKKLEGTLKAAQREEASERMKFLKRIAKARKKGAEL